MRIENWTKLDSYELWLNWRELFTSDNEAIAHAIWVANRLVKEKAHSTRKAFYEFKDEFLRRYQTCLVEGRRVREETMSCIACGGDGKYLKFGMRKVFRRVFLEGDQSDSCTYCDGTGRISGRLLYVHNLVIEGQRYSFHSYVEPSSLSSELGEDKENYGGRFSEEELAELALPFSGLLKILRYLDARQFGATGTNAATFCACA